MKVSDIKQLLTTLKSVTFQLPNGTFVPEHLQTILVRQQQDNK